MEQLICQSCAMPMEKEADFGTEANGTKNNDYCCYCYQGGKFTSEESLDDMIETCINPCIEAGVYPDAETARKAMNEFFPQLKRWKTQ